MEDTRILAEYARRREIPANRYALAWPAALFTRQNLHRHVIGLLARNGICPPANLDALDVGCGWGNRLRDLVHWGADPARLHGVDLDPERSAAAQRKLPESDIHTGSAAVLPWADGSFDLITQFVVFTSILDPDVKAQIAREMLRVLKPSGMILWYDFRVNNPRNRNVRGIGASEIRRLFPGCPMRIQSLTLAPPLAELIAPLSWSLAHVAEALPFLRTHLLASIRHG